MLPAAPGGGKPAPGRRTDVTDVKRELASCPALSLDWHEVSVTAHRPGRTREL